MLLIGSMKQIFTPAVGFQPKAIGSFICHKTPFPSITIHPEDGGRVPLSREQRMLLCSRRPVGDVGIGTSSALRFPQRSGYMNHMRRIRRTRLNLFRFARSPQCPTRFRSGVLAVFDDLPTVHEHMFYTGRVLMRFFKGGMICDRRRIEHHHVGEHSFLEKSAVIEPAICLPRSNPWPCRLDLFRAFSRLQQASCPSAASAFLT